MNSRMITWPVPDPGLPETVDPVLAEAARAATAAFRSARERFDPTWAATGTGSLTWRPRWSWCRGRGAVIDALGRPVEVDNDLSRRWSGVVAASPALAEELAAVIRGS